MSLRNAVVLRSKRRTVAVVSFVDVVNLSIYRGIDDDSRAIEAAFVLAEWRATRGRGTFRKSFVLAPIQRVTFERVGVPHMASGTKHVGPINMQSNRGFITDTLSHVYRLRPHWQDGSPLEGYLACAGQRP